MFPLKIYKLHFSRASAQQERHSQTALGVVWGLGECYWCPIQLSLTTNWVAPTPLRAFQLLALLRSGLFMPINNETRPPTIEASVGQSRARGPFPSFVPMHEPRCLAATAAAAAPPWGLISILARHRSIIRLISSLKRHKKPRASSSQSSRVCLSHIV